MSQCKEHSTNLIVVTFLIVTVLVIGQKLDPSEMLPHIASVRQAVRFALSDFKGKELPGFSIPKKVSQCLCEVCL